MSSIGSEDYVLVRRSEVKSEIKGASSSASSPSTAVSVPTGGLRTVAPSESKEVKEKTEEKSAVQPLLLAKLKSAGGYGKVGKTLAIKCNQNLIITLPYAGGSSPYAHEINVTNLGEWTTLALLFEQYRVKKVEVQLDTHGMTSTYLANLSTTSSTLTGVSMAHAMMSTVINTTGMTYDNLLDIQNSKFLDYGRSKNIFKISCTPLCHHTSSGVAQVDSGWQATVNGGTHRWGVYVLSKQSGIMTQDVLMFGRVIMHIEFRNRK